MEIQKLSENNRTQLLQRPAQNNSEIYESVCKIINEVKKCGDQALLDFAAKYDGAEVTQLLVTDEELLEAQRLVNDQLKSAIQHAAGNIEKFHKLQRPKSKKVIIETGVTCWQEYRPIEKVGLYIPGGTAPLFSTVLMLAIPAKIAGCENMILCTPPSKSGKIDPSILYTANLCGVRQIYKTGGAQAIAALAYGTESIPSVDKIFGPGNSYVTQAKQIVSTDGVAIDLPAGPSELLIIADETADSRFIAADLLSQSEHGPDSQTLLVSTHAALLEDVQRELAKQVQQLTRSAILEKSMRNTRLVYTVNVDGALSFSNEYAPEHLILAVKNAEQISQKVTHA